MELLATPLIAGLGTLAPGPVPSQLGSRQLWGEKDGGNIYIVGINATIVQGELKEQLVARVQNTLYDFSGTAAVSVSGVEPRLNPDQVPIEPATPRHGSPHKTRQKYDDNTKDSLVMQLLI